ncbi:hypothetical protein C1H46_013035 [Malus baccata]|uniref:X8 domain-containing protein n=1 Tax=Malus baccata TaxID=106549 RepID=A0A540MRD2_MALBA|nr:hypothetical protein C1H46_013035 [Malus baccata]
MEVTKRPLGMFATGLALLLCFAAAQGLILDFENHSGYRKRWGSCNINSAKPSADVEKLWHNIDYSCGQAGIDCRPIQPGGSCFSPESAVSHASVAMKLFFRATGKHFWDCHFNGTGLVVSQNPSVGTCEYLV